jgi:hypothetical protein
MTYMDEPVGEVVVTLHRLEDRFPNPVYDVLIRDRTWWRSALNGQPYSWYKISWMHHGRIKVWRREELHELPGPGSYGREGGVAWG